MDKTQEGQLELPTCRWRAVACMLVLQWASGCTSENMAPRKDVIDALRAIVQAQATFRDEDRDKNQRPDYAGSIEALAAASVLPEGLRSGEAHGYRFSVQLQPEEDGALASWSCIALPRERPGTLYWTDDTGVISYLNPPPPPAPAAPATATVLGLRPPLQLVSTGYLLDGGSIMLGLRDAAGASATICLPRRDYSPRVLHTGHMEAASSRPLTPVEEQAVHASLLAWADGVHKGPWDDALARTLLRFRNVQPVIDNLNERY